MSVLSMLDRDLAVVYPRLAPIRLLELLAEHGVRTIDVPDEEFDSMGPNVLALAPRVALVADGNPETRRRLEAAGVDVTGYASAELGKGDGGPTCLTRPLLRTE
jgi:N-dimethylarginine dimethylaminohydrolase